ncbi:alpha/beta hydrolase [Chelativorans sp. AA-79]|uniref:alpha/beta hydrolase n=1 Tax=Chelativorans sp. AA-79 TaxID=3028735 RepID=UPI0023F91344|nr:alpha/beta hydrolase [Chelativorans sp. AA-79]WEX08178.1 alpha/beta hydrolase [Chelativorans sp. AA-79]
MLLLLLLPAGCMHQESHRLIAQTIAPASQSQIAGKHRILVATTRAETPRPGVVFSGNRALATTFAFVDMTVPAVHETGKLERSPSPKVADPARYFAARRLGIYADSQAFSRAISKNIEENGGRALVFVHGFNTGFDSAVYRMTQIVHDAGYKGAPILFTWPSAGRLVDYIYDNNSATASRDALEDLLRLVARSGARRIDIVAHSMGTWVTMEALRQLAITGNRDLGGKLADVVLASPDIDVDVFKTQMRRYGVPDRSFFVLTSRDDRALDLSRFLAGNQARVGGSIDPAELAKYGVIVVDVTDVSSPDRLNHAKFAENPLLVRLLGEGLADSDEPPSADQELVRRINALAGSIGQTIGTAADIVITTPLDVLGAVVE